jgi:malto-oligosyltrehalose trehalohydrolase
MTSYAHHMPFGATVRPDGRVQFRLWAPALDRLSLVIEGATSPLAMQRQDEGWFELITDAAQSGARYSFQLPDGQRVADPASRRQAAGVHGPSVAIDPQSYEWRSAGWSGRPWRDVILYELHVGAFTNSGDFDGVLQRLDWLERLGVTAIELMPVADFPGRRNWGYDGVLPFAPASAYGSPDALKALIDAAHERGLMVFLDVVYNHFGPDGNYLSLYAPQFFTERHHTPWGAAIDFSNPVVRSFFIHNALYWLEEFRFDGLRLDAVHAIVDDSPTHILTELARTVRTTCDKDRHLHLVLENDANQVRFLHRDTTLQFDAQWNDDFHHASHVVLTRESEGYYVDYQKDPLQLLGQALAQGFVYQGEASLHRGGAPRGEPSDTLPMAAFVAFLQNHDQVGNRAFGERLPQLVRPELLKASASILLLAPQVPMLFMGEEWAANQPFQFFCDFEGELAEAVRAGRRREFAKFPAFSDPAVRKRIPDPNDPATFDRSKLDWTRIDEIEHADHLQFCRELLAIRRREIMPHLDGAWVRDAVYSVTDGGLLHVSWLLGEGHRLDLIANLGSDTSDDAGPEQAGRLLHSTHPGVPGDRIKPGWYVAWYLTDGGSPP